MARNRSTAPWATPGDGEDDFAEWWERAGQLYETAALERGGIPWVSDPGKRAAVTAKLGLPADIPDAVLRRALWERRYRRPEPPQGLTIPNVRNKK